MDAIAGSPDNEAEPSHRRMRASPAASPESAPCSPAGPGPPLPGPLGPVHRSRPPGRLRSLAALVEPPPAPQRTRRLSTHHPLHQPPRALHLAGQHGSLRMIMSCSGAPLAFVERSSSVPSVTAGRVGLRQWLLRSSVGKSKFRCRGGTPCYGRLVHEVLRSHRRVLPSFRAPNRHPVGEQVQPKKELLSGGEVQT
jgi:hypothetical protein